MKSLVSLILGVLWCSVAAYAQQPCKNNVPTADGLLVITRDVNGIRKSGFISRTGAVVVEPKYDEAYPSSDGLALVRSGDLYGFVDLNGTEIIRPRYEYACSFSEGLASVKVEGKYGYINTDGTLKITPQFDNAYNFSDGLAIIKVNWKIDATKDLVEPQYGYIDKTGKTVIAANFDAASDFHGGVATVVDSVFGLETYINKQGKVLFRRTERPTPVLGIAPSLIEVKFDSIPSGAKIYLIPKRRLDLDPTLTTTDENTLNEFLVPCGPTPVSCTAKQKVFTVLLILNGERRQAPLDVRPDASNIAKVSFQ